MSLCLSGYDLGRSGEPVFVWYDLGGSGSVCLSGYDVGGSGECVFVCV